jgi:hypothetical protein
LISRQQAHQGETTMGEDTNRDGLQQQSDETQRQQAGQQNQQGETRTPQQQQDDAARNAPGQQNQQGERQRRPEGEDVAGEGVDTLNNGLEGGVDTGAIQPGRTGQG